MSHWYGFYILPFDWRDTEQRRPKLPLDATKLAKQLQSQCPDGEVVVSNDAAQVLLYIQIATNEPWVAAQFGADAPTILAVSAYPKWLAIKLILWYRRFVPAKYILFIMYHPDGTGFELTFTTSAEEIEQLFPKA
jgi:hypothetical protein